MHLGDIPTRSTNVRFRGKRGPGLIAVSANNFDCDAAQFSFSSVVPSPSPTWCSARRTEDGGNSWRQRPWVFFVSIAMTTSTHSYHGYELALHHESDDRYRVTIFDPKGNRIASTGTHLERQGALTEASRRVNQLLAQRRAT